MIGTLIETNDRIIAALETYDTVRSSLINDTHRKLIGVVVVVEANGVRERRRRRPDQFGSSEDSRL